MLHDNLAMAFSRTVMARHGVVGQENMNPKKWSEQNKRRILAEAGTYSNKPLDRRTLERFIAGLPIREHSEERIKATVRKLKL